VGCEEGSREGLMDVVGNWLRLREGLRGYGLRNEAEFTDTLRTFCLHLEEIPLGSYFCPNDICVSNALNNSCSIYSLVSNFYPSLTSLVRDSLEI
jgi:hypothetical protein